MSYGFEILTNQGHVDVANINVARFLSSYTRTSYSGSLTESNFSTSNGLGHISCATNDGKIVPEFTWNNSTKVLSWQTPTDQSGSGLIPQSLFSTNFTFSFWIFD